MSEFFKTEPFDHQRKAFFLMKNHQAFALLLEQGLGKTKILLDDAARHGERLVARRWRQRWPKMRFDYDRRGAKGTLIGRWA
jgi:hypothetical protein